MEATTRVRLGDAECGLADNISLPSVHRVANAVNLSATSQNKILGSTFRRLFQIDLKNEKKIPLR